MKLETLKLEKRLRKGFTLVELLVAAALTMLIMAIIGTAFQQALASLSNLKSYGDLADRLRSAENALRQDLETPHFLGGEINTDGDSPGKLRVSDLLNNRKPVGGYLKITGGAGSVEGYDQDGISSTKAIDNTIAMTVVRGATSPNEFFTDGATTSRYGEVLWTLSAAPTANINGVPTYALYRYQKVLADLNAITATSNGARLGRQDPSVSSGSIVLSNVISFEVKPTWEGGAVPRAALAGGSNGDYPFDNVSGGIFDTDTPGVRVTAVLIKIRIYDPKNKTTRQSSIIVKL